MSDEVTPGRRPVAVVSGGSRGIGRAVVQRLALDGYDVALCYQSNAEAAELTAKTARDAGAEILVRQADVTDERACRDLVTAARRELGGLDVVVANAGVVEDGLLAMTSSRAWARVVETNLTGTYNLCRAAVGPLMRNRSGSVVTISSVVGVRGNAGQTNYAAAKAGVVGFSLALAKEVGRFGVRVNAVTPGLIQTDLTAELTRNLQGQPLPNIALNRLGRPEEVAELVSFLASGRAAYITAGVFAVDGGLAM